MDEEIRVLGSAEVEVHATLHGTQVAKVLSDLPEDERLPFFKRAAEVGVLCMERAQASEDLDYVRKEINELVTHIRDATGKIPKELEKELVEKVNAEDGEVLQPLKEAAEDTGKTLDARLKTLQEMFDEKMDPEKSTSVLGKALEELRDLADPKNKDSIHSRFSEALKEATSKDGQMATSVKEVVAKEIEPLTKEIDDLAKEVRVNEKAKELRDQTTAKGDDYEVFVVERVQAWAAQVGVEVHHVGTDNKPGDVLLVFPAENGAEPTRLVIEARDRSTNPVGRKPISDQLRKAMAERDADVAVYVNRTIDGLAKEIGNWQDGKVERGPWVATIDRDLLTAVRYIKAKHDLAVQRQADGDLDVSEIEAEIGRIRTAMKRIGQINTNVTSVQTSASAIKDEAEQLRDEITDALFGLEQCARKAKGHGADETGEEGAAAA